MRPPAVEEAGPAEAESGALVQWTPPHAPSQLGKCRLQALYEAIPVPKQGPAWQRWLTRHPVQYELPAGVSTDLPALLEAADAPCVERVAVRLSKVMDEATAGDVAPRRRVGVGVLFPPVLRGGTPNSTTRTLARSAVCGTRLVFW